MAKVKKPKGPLTKPLAPAPTPGTMNRWDSEGGAIPGVLPVHHEKITPDPPKKTRAPA